MSEIDRLLARYKEQITIPWGTIKSSTERTIFVIYDRNRERQLRYRFESFQDATVDAKKKWIPLDVTDSFSNWFAAHDYRDEYFQYPEDLPGFKDGWLEEFEGHLAHDLLARLKEKATPDHCVAVLGVGSLFGVARVSELMKRVAEAVPGRLVIFFPGEKIDNNYRLLGARDGWNYLATAITAD
jgi:hypothetical protein